MAGYTITFTGGKKYHMTDFDYDDGSSRVTFTWDSTISIPDLKLHFELPAKFSGVCVSSSSDDSNQETVTASAKGMTVLLYLTGGQVTGGKFGPTASIVGGGDDDDVETFTAAADPDPDPGG